MSLCFFWLQFVLCVFFFFLMIRRPPRSTRTDTLFPYTTLFRSSGGGAPHASMDTPIEAWILSMPISIANSAADWMHRSEEHTSELQSLMRISYAVFCLKKKKTRITNKPNQNIKKKLTDKQESDNHNVLQMNLATSPSTKS